MYTSPDLRDIDVLVLAGGLGTRLRGVIHETPKILAPVSGRPFLYHLLRWLSRAGVRRITLSLGYRAEDVIAWLGTVQFPELRIQTVIEPEPLGTGGALAYSRPHLVSDPVLVLNGDTLAGVDLGAFLQAYRKAGTEACIMCVNVEDAGRYGMVEINETDRVVRFAEKVTHATGANWINAGFYLFSSGFLDKLARTLTKGSLERDVLERMPPRSIGAFRTSARFLDIGTPETLAIASEIIELKS